MWKQMGLFKAVIIKYLKIKILESQGIYRDYDWTERIVENAERQKRLKTMVVSWKKNFGYVLV